MPCRFTELRRAHLQSPVAALVGAATADRYGRVRGGERMNGAPVLSPPCSMALRRRNFLTAAGAAVAVLAPGTRPARAQSERQHRIAIMTSVIPGDLISETGGDRGSRLLFSALRRLGYVEGRNLVIERYSAEGQPARLSTLARQAVERKPDLIIAIGDPVAHAFVTATDTIPIIATFADSVS